MADRSVQYNKLISFLSFFSVFNSSLILHILLCTDGSLPFHDHPGRPKRPGSGPIYFHSAPRSSSHVMMHRSAAEAATHRSSFEYFPSCPAPYCWRLLAGVQTVVHPLGHGHGGWDWFIETPGVVPIGCLHLLFRPKVLVSWCSVKFIVHQMYQRFFFFRVAVNGARSNGVQGCSERIGEKKHR